MAGGNKEDEANERRAREKLLARRNSAREAASSATQTVQETNGGSSKSVEKPVKDNSLGQKGANKKPAPSSSNPTKKKQLDTVNANGPNTSASSAARKPNGPKRRRRPRERNRVTRMSNRGGGETSSAAGHGGPRDRGRGPPAPRGGNGRHPPSHQHRDEFGRIPPPRWGEYDHPPPPGGPGYYNDHRGPPHMRHRGRGGGHPPPHFREGGGAHSDRWERDRGNPNSMNALPPHPRGSHRGGRPRSPPPHLSSRDRRHRIHRDDRNHRNRDLRESHRHRNRRGRSHESERSRSHSSRSRSKSRSISSYGSSSSFSSSEGGSRRSGESNSNSDVSRSCSSSRSRSRSCSRSRSPSPQSPGGSKIQKDSEKDDATIDQQKKKDDGIKDKYTLAKSQKDEVKKEEVSNGPQSPTSKESTSSQKNSKAVVNRGRSHSRSASQDSRGRSRQRGRERKRKNSRKKNRSSRSRSHSPASSISRSHSPASLSHSTSSSHYSRERRRERKSKRRRKRQNRGSSSRGDKYPEDGFSKDQRTIFVSQLVMRTTERDLKRYFKKKVGCKVNDVILLRDRRNARNHKGCAYVEVGRIEDVATAVAVSGQAPDFQRFPILIKASEAEKNYVNPLAAPSATNDTINASANSMIKTESLAGAMSSATAVTPITNIYVNTNSYDREKQATGTSSFLPPLRDENGRLIESQKVYVGGLDPSAKEEHLHALFSPFGNLKKVQLQCHPNTQISRGYAFLTFHDPKVAHLAIRTMAGKFVSGRPLKTGWANQNQQSPASIASGCTVVTSDQFPENASELTQKALFVLAQMTGGITAAAEQQLTVAATIMGASSSGNSGCNTMDLANMAEQELDKAMGLVGTATTISTSNQALPTVAEARASMAAGGAVSLGATVADARASLAADVAARQLAAATSAAAAAAAETRAAATAKSSFIGNTSNGPTIHLLVHNMYNKDEETEDGWEAEIKEDFLDECSKFGKIDHAKVMHKEPGGKIFATFADVEGAKTCAENLAGRWFDKRQLRVDYMPEANPP